MFTRVPPIGERGKTEETGQPIKDLLPPSFLPSFFRITRTFPIGTAGSNEEGGGREGGKEEAAGRSSIVYLMASQREERRKEKREGTFSLLYLNLKVFDNTLPPSLFLPPTSLCTTVCCLPGDCSSCLMAVKERENLKAAVAAAAEEIGILPVDGKRSLRQSVCLSVVSQSVSPPEFRATN